MVVRRLSSFWLLLMAIGLALAQEDCHKLDFNGGVDLAERMAICNPNFDVFFHFISYPVHLDLSNWNQTQFDAAFIRTDLEGNQHTMKIAANVTIVNSNLTSAHLVAVATNISGENMAFTIKNNKKLFNATVTTGKIAINGTDPKLKLVVHGNKLIMSSQLTKMRGLINVASADIQDVGECDFGSKPLADMFELSDCEYVFGDLVINEETKEIESNATSRLNKRLSEIRGCLRIINSNLDGVDFLSGVDKRKQEMHCKYGWHIIADNKKICQNIQDFDNIAKKFVNLKIINNAICNYGIMGKEPYTVDRDLIFDESTDIKSLKKYDSIEVLKGSIFIRNTSWTNVKIFPNLERIERSKKLSNSHRKLFGSFESFPAVRPTIAVTGNKKMRSFDIPKLKKIVCSKNPCILFEDNGFLSMTQKQANRWAALTEAFPANINVSIREESSEGNQKCSKLSASHTKVDMMRCEGKLYGQLEEGTNFDLSGWAQDEYDYFIEHPLKRFSGRVRLAHSQLETVFIHFDEESPMTHEVEIIGNAKLRYLMIAYESRISRPMKIRIRGNPQLETIVDLKKIIFPRTSTVDIQEFGEQLETGECLIEKPLLSLDELKNCPIVNGDLIITELTEIAESNNWKIEKIKGCLKIINSRLVEDFTKDKFVFQPDSACNIEIHGNRYLKQEFLDKMRAVQPTGDIQQRTGECYFDREPLKALDQLVNCSYVQGDLFMDSETKISKSDGLKLEEIRGCLRIQETSLDRLDFLAQLRIDNSINCQDKGEFIVEVKNNQKLNQSTLDRFEEVIKLSILSKYLIQPKRDVCDHLDGVPIISLKMLEGCSQFIGRFLVAFSQPPKDFRLKLEINGCIVIEQNRELLNLDWMSGVTTIGNCSNHTITQNEKLCVLFHEEEEFIKRLGPIQFKDNNRTCQTVCSAEYAVRCGYNYCRKLKGDLIISGFDDSNKPEHLIFVDTVYGTVKIQNNTFSRLDFIWRLTKVDARGSNDSTSRAAVMITRNPNLGPVLLSALKEIYPASESQKKLAIKNNGLVTSIRHSWAKSGLATTFDNSSEIEFEDDPEELRQAKRERFPKTAWTFELLGLDWEPYFFNQIFSTLITLPFLYYACKFVRVAYHKYVVHVLAKRQGEGPRMISNLPEAYVRYCHAYMVDNRSWIDDLVDWIATEQPGRPAPPAASPPLTRWERWSRWMSRVPAMRNKRSTRLMMDESLETWERNDLIRREFEEKEGPTTRPYNPKDAEKYRKF